MWNATEYLRFAGERSRPFADLLAQVQHQSPRVVVDLGCGPGNQTRTLAERWPGARVIGVDSSADMLAKAQPLAIPGRLEFVASDIGQWSPEASPEAPVDVILSNAALHWLADHERLLKRLAGMLNPDGALAVQMPNRFGSPSQVVIEEAAADPRWAARLRGVGLHRESVMPISWYVSQLRALGFAVNAWETTYIHVLAGENPVLQWFKGTALRPLLDRLDAPLQAEFEALVGERLRRAYPPTGDVTLFPMPRLFFVASRT
jgi:trans-aconitate 2-methyltransferase